ncbi:hypothetical protein I4U23_031226 [Adineta vaga]|nr:hypothetical protein I4U23_031226 [Adineta vaga]
MCLFFARLNFENDFIASMLTYNGTSSNGPTFISFPNIKGIHTITGLCPRQSQQECFQFGLPADLSDTLPIRINEWTYIAIVYSKSKSKQILYVNGILDNSRIPSSGPNDVLVNAFNYNSTDGLKGRQATGLRLYIAKY